MKIAIKRRVVTFVTTWRFSKILAQINTNKYNYLKKKGGKYE